DAQETETPAEEPATIDLADLLGDQVTTPLEEGSTITIEQNCPLLLVSTVEEVTVTRDIAPTLETQEDPTMFLGQQRVVQEGQAGQASVLSRVVKRCGVPVANNDVSSVVLSEPTSLIVGTGTKDMPELPDGCLFLWPVQGTITSPFGYRYIFGETNFHRGLDIAAPMGTAINAAADGTVTFAGVRGTYGNLVVITHDNGFVTYYAHCSKLLVEAGDQVTQGTPIAAVGSTGRSTGPHCHFEVRYQNEPVDPLAYLPGENNAPVRAPIDVEEEPEETPEEEAPETETPEPEPPQEPSPDTPAEPSTPPEEPSDQPETPTVPEEPVQPEPPADDPAAGGDTPDPAPETQPALPAQQAKEPDAVG
ncbi:MAG TPA: peptidoglycan DD-metalloendopeptidase family protein, partial [Candidatus Evtepia faecavium]|nr:peptidoglycan DD-metalloendopeptidase family protein [Candidatus Evtepia faecavium]